MKVTAKWLRSKFACKDELKVFENEWPDGMPITKEAIVRAFALGLDVDFGVEQILSEPAIESYETQRVVAWGTFHSSTNREEVDLATYRDTQADLLVPLLRAALQQGDTP